MSKPLPLVAALAIAAFFPLQTTLAHCQVPCGIYDDSARVTSMLEDAETVAKAAAEIQKLSGTHDPQEHQQLVRWVMNKESHAQQIITTIADYYLTQRVKPSQEDYEERLLKHHTVILLAMKAKQQADPAVAAQLSDAIQALAPYYPHAH